MGKMGDSAYADKYPIMGFPTYYYPYNMQDNYLSPFVVVQFFNLPKGETVKMSCQLWGKDIEINRQRRLGIPTLKSYPSRARVFFRLYLLCIGTISAISTRCKTDERMKKTPTMTKVSLNSLRN